MVSPYNLSNYAIFTYIPEVQDRRTVVHESVVYATSVHLI